MESLIPIINNLHEISKVIGDDGIKLPQVVVVGSQGSGKSSVLENIVGRSFLPKGTGIVTRTPLVLNLVYSPREPGPNGRQVYGALDVDEFGVFSHTDAVFMDLNNICKEIQRRTETIAGKNKGIGNQEITLNLYSAKLANLTLVDLPGLTKFPVGDQPDDVEIYIRKLALKYITKPNVIIVAVVPANTDIATNESLKLVKDCDPKGDRTLVVLTKLDLMDVGTDATDILMGRVIPVKLGIVAVVNRSQKDIDNKKPIAQVQKDEAQFLRKRYPSLAHVNGTSSLVAKLQQIYLNRIKDYLYEVRIRVGTKSQQVDALVDFYSDGDEDKDKGLMKIIKEFSSAYSDEIKTSAAGNIQSTSLSGEQRIFHMLHETFKANLNCSNPGSRREDIQSSVRNAAIFEYNPEIILKDLLKAPFKELEIESVYCLKRVWEEMEHLLWKCAYEKELLVKKFPALRSKVLNTVESLLLAKKSLTEKVIREETFHNLSCKILRILRFDKRSNVLSKEQFLNESETGKCDAIERLLDSCLESAPKTVYHVVTATVMQDLVYEVRNTVRDVLLGKFSSPGAGRIFHGAEDFAEKRALKRTEMKRLYDAMGDINELKNSIKSLLTVANQ